MTPNQKRASWVAAAIVVVGAFEGYSATAYPDIIGVPTICYGETKGVHLGDKATRAQCDEKLSSRLVEFNAGVSSCINVDLPDSRRVAFVSLAYNIGTAAFCKSTVVRKINAGDVAGSCDAILMWNKAGGSVRNGLTQRRKKEREMCLQGVLP